ncbi:MAG: hypothetical protein Q7V01_07290 [Vicinamibacterales bacterium]|nr:hypothetical protein [Vicinamibacterales bacterium]
MSVRSADTHPEAERVQRDALRALSVRQRLAQVDELNALVEALALADLRRRHPEAGEPRLQELLRERRSLVPGTAEFDASHGSVSQRGT